MHESCGVTDRLIHVPGAIFLAELDFEHSFTGKKIQGEAAFPERNSQRNGFSAGEKKHFLGDGNLQYAVKGDVQYAKVLNPAGNYVRPSAETISAACRAVEEPQWDKFATSLANAPGVDSYPIVSFSWLYLPVHLSDSRHGAALDDLFTWMFGDGQASALKEGYPALPQPLLTTLKSKGIARWLHP